VNGEGQDVRAAAEAAARNAYGRLLAYLASQTRNIAAAEDALADAFASALAAWPASDVPENPEAWLLTAARRKSLDARRHASVRAAAEPTLALMAQRSETEMAFPDERLKLLFVCAHPAIDAAARTPLMLQAVLGLDAARIASAFLVSPTAMGQRLVRAKAKIKDAGIAFALPESDELPQRLDAVLAAIYVAFASGWDDLAEDAREALDGEAMWLGETLATLMPDEPEILGLRALMLHCQTWRAARRDAAGAFVSHAATLARPGRYQLEAAIQSVHAGRAVTGATDWRALSLLDAALAAQAPSMAIHVGQAAVEARNSGPQAGLDLLDRLPTDAALSYQPYWAVRAYLTAQIA